MQTRPTFARCFPLLALAALACVTVAIGPAQADSYQTLAIDNGSYFLCTRSHPFVADLFTFSSGFTLQSIEVHENADPTPAGDITLMLWANSGGTPGSVLWSSGTQTLNQGDGWDSYSVAERNFSSGGSVFVGLQLGTNGFAPYDTASPGAGKSYYADALAGPWTLGAGGGATGNLMVRLDGVLVASTPEPASIILIGASCGMFGLLRRRKARR